MAINWQRVEPWIQPYCQVKNQRLYHHYERLKQQNIDTLKKQLYIGSKELSNRQIITYEKEFKINLPEDFKEFHRKYNQEIYWSIGCWIFLPLIEALHYTQNMGEILFEDDLYGDGYEQCWNPQWLVFTEHIKTRDIMCLNLDPKADLESEKSIFYRSNEVFKFEYENESGYVCPMKIGFARWLEKWAIKLEKNH